MDFSEPLEKIIRKRISVRTYSKDNLDICQLNSVKEFLNSSHQGPFGSGFYFQLLNLKELDPEKRMKLGTYGLIKGAKYFIASSTIAVKHTLIDYGFCLEKIILKLTELNLGTCWLGGFNKETFGKFMQIKEKEIVPAITVFGIPAKKNGIIQIVAKNVIRARKRKNWDELFFNNDFNNVLLESDAAEYVFPLEMLRLCPSAKNRQPWRILKIKDKFHFYVKTSIDTSNKLPRYAQLDMGIALCHFILACQERHLNGKLVVDDPKIFSAPRNYKYITTWQKEQ